MKWNRVTFGGKPNSMCDPPFRFIKHSTFIVRLLHLLLRAGADQHSHLGVGCDVRAGAGGDFHANGLLAGADGITGAANGVRALDGGRRQRTGGRESKSGDFGQGGFGGNGGAFGQNGTNAFGVAGEDFGVDGAGGVAGDYAIVGISFVTFSAILVRAVTVSPLAFASKRLLTID